MGKDITMQETAAKTPETNEQLASQEKYQLSMEAMLKSGVHFGHKRARWNPKMKSYVFGVRNGVHIIDLEKTKEMFQVALDFLGEVVDKNGMVLFVGTKKQAKELIKSVAERVEMPYVNERWLGGTFSNFNVIIKRVKYLTETREGLEKGKFNDLTKLERLKLQKEVEKLEEKMGGLERMKKLPDVMFVLDINKDMLAVKEARAAGVKVVGLVDSNCDPTAVDYAIPANDDALSSLRYIMGVVLKKVLETQQNIKPAKTKSEE